MCPHDLVSAINLVSSSDLDQLDQTVKQQIKGNVLVKQIVYDS